MIKSPLLQDYLRKEGLPPIDNLPAIPPNNQRLFQLEDVLPERYQLKKHYTGGHGGVLLCYDRQEKRDVALKTILSFGATAQEMADNFIREIDRLTKLSPHPNVLTFRQIQVIDGYDYIVSDWISDSGQESGTMTALLDSRAFTLAEIVDYMQQLCEALLHCQSCLRDSKRDSYVFEDLKPDNILMRFDANEKKTYAMLADFSGGYTETWSAPEQLSHSHALDQRTDIYCLGKISEVMLSRILEEEMDSPFYNELYRVIETCVEPEMEERFPSVEALRERLRELCGQLGLQPYQPYTRRLNPMTEEFERYKYRLALAYFPPDSKRLQEILNPSKPLLFSPPGMKDWMLSVRKDNDSDVALNAAKEYMLLGKLKEALAHLASDNMSAEYLCLKGVLTALTGNPQLGLAYINASLISEFSLNACDCKANILLDYPNVRPAYMLEINAHRSALASLVKRQPGGYLIHQVIAKYELLVNSLDAAHDAFRQSLRYPNIKDKWRTLYYYGRCEYLELNISSAREIYSEAIRDILANPLHDEDMDCAIKLFFCYHALADADNARRQADFLRTRFQADYTVGVLGLQQDLEAAESYRTRIKNEETALASDLAALQVSMRNLMAELEGDAAFTNRVLRARIAAAIASREARCAFQNGDYAAAALASDKGLRFDHTHPILLANKTECM